MPGQARFVTVVCPGGQFSFPKDLVLYDRLRRSLWEEREAARALLTPDRTPSETARMVLCTLEEAAAGWKARAAGGRITGPAIGAVCEMDAMPPSDRDGGVLFFHSGRFVKKCVKPL